MHVSTVHCMGQTCPGHDLFLFSPVIHHPTADGVQGSAREIVGVPSMKIMGQQVLDCLERNVNIWQGCSSQDYC